MLKDNRVRAVRLLAAADQSEPLVVRAINLRLMVEVSGVVRNPAAAIGDGNVAVTKGDTEFAYPIGACTSPSSTGASRSSSTTAATPCTYSGPISGSGKVEIYAGGPNAPLTLDGKAPNTMQGTWAVKAGRVVLAKQPGVDAMGGTIVVGGGERHGAGLERQRPDQRRRARPAAEFRQGRRQSEPERLQRHDRPADAGRRDARC